VTSVRRADQALDLMDLMQTGLRPPDVVMRFFVIFGDMSRREPIDSRAMHIPASNKLRRSSTDLWLVQLYLSAGRLS
jgi:hypothetical protein